MNEQPQGKPTSELLVMVELWDGLQPYQQRELIETARAMTADAPRKIEECECGAWVWQDADSLYHNFPRDGLHTCPSPEPQSLRA